MVFIEKCDFRGDKEQERNIVFCGEDEETRKVLKENNIIDRINRRFTLRGDNIAIVAKDNILPIPFKSVPHPDYPEPWVTVSFKEFHALIKAMAYVIKRRFDFAPGTRVGVIANSLPITHLLVYTLWTLRCIVVFIPPKIGNDVKQYWVRHIDIKMIFYDINFRPFDDDNINKELNEQCQWIWKWTYPLTEEDEGISAGKEGINMFYFYDEDFRNEIYNIKLEGKGYYRKGCSEDVLTVVGTSSSSQAIIKNGQCSKMKFVPWQMVHLGNFSQKSLTIQYEYFSPFFLDIPYHHSMGITCALSYNINCGGPIVYHTQQLYEVGFIPEMVLTDIVETKSKVIQLFPFHFVAFKKLFDDKHPKCEYWSKYLGNGDKSKLFRSGGAPLNPMVKKWFKDTFDIQIITGCGSSEGGYILHEIVDDEVLPGEESYIWRRVPWVDFLILPLNENEPNIGELYTRNEANVPGYIGRPKPGEFYDSPVPGMRIDINADELYVEIDGEKYFKTNDVVRRSPLSGKYKYVSRIDSILTFATGIKMNPMPFEETIMSECQNIKKCCLILDSTQTEVVCFIEPNWNEIIINDDDMKFNTNINPETLSRDRIKSMNKIARQQTWDSIYKVLMDDSKSLTNWSKQLTINNIFIIDYGKKFPSTDKGSLSRRVARLQYAYVLKYISKLISGEITELPDEDEMESSPINTEEMKVTFTAKNVDTILNMEVNNDNDKFKDNNNNNNNNNNNERVNLHKKEEEKIQKEKEIKKEKEDKEKGEEEEEEEIKKENDNKEEVQKEEEIQKEEIQKEEEVQKENKKEKIKSQKVIDDEIDEAIKIIYYSVKEIIPSTPEFEDFNPERPFNFYGIDSLATIKLTNIISRKLGKRYTPAVLFNYGAINNAKSLWMTLLKGKNCVVAPVKNRDLHTNYVNKPSNQLLPNEHNIPYFGCYDTKSNVAKPSQFDAEFFNCLPDEALSLDPRHRWILETTWEALENAGIPINSLKNTTTGVFVGINDDHEYSDLLEENGISIPISSHSNHPSDIAGRLSYFYNLYGPSYTMDTACSTGASAIHVACRSLQNRDCNLCMVTGVKYMYSSKSLSKACSARMISPHGRCATFDIDADGFVPGEGCVTYILKRLNDAIEDNDNILSVIIGSSSGQSGLRQSISAPSSEGQALNIRKAMEFAQVKPEDISYVEAHGTGTPLGDAMEIHALNEVYAGTHSKENPLIVGSIKTNIGHTCEVAGLAGLAKVIVSLQHKHIPRNLHFNKPNPDFDLNSIPIKIPTKTLPWNSLKPGKPLIAQVSSFGLQGSIIHLIIEEYIPKNISINKNEIKNENENKNINEKEYEIKNENEDENKNINENENENHILTISAKSYAALIELGYNYINTLERMEEENEDICDLCYTSNIGREHFNEYRLSAYGKNANELCNSLEKALDDLENKIHDENKLNHHNNNNNISSSPSSSSLSSSRKITQMINIFIENKNTSISENIYKLLLELTLAHPVFKEALDECDVLISEILNNNYSLIDDLVNKGKNSNKNYQIFGIISFYYALSKILDEELKINQSINFGYDIGELIAILLNNGISIRKVFEFLKLVQEKDENSINNWYSEDELEGITYLASQHRKYKIGDIIPKEYYINLYQILTTSTTINNNNNNNEEEENIKQTFETIANVILDQHDKKYKNISIFSQNLSMANEIKEILLSKCKTNLSTQITDNHIISFFDTEYDDEYEKRILPRYISNMYNIGNDIDWYAFHQRINSKNYQKYSLHKINLPNYPFQRSTYWPKIICQN
ncbi:hypothetical protein BCR32DRAFT_266215 [Anaeromyces robustus]|uniref:Ketosynthase family 3 (KS3) domain-containing protein n=1 Tax=Anaeromyces robustus TaxID=1754192 RepID=A0A1Y1XFU7_9FUNG|nr:hypothetical protein BCR32DRAFT_266215 [Anaeromyces robustus]|eukprot:ORX84593.1 hypothetical protein BCR32DRAFT_266215 [Anaeromyces robustus]